VSPTARVTGELLRFGPHAGAHRAALRAGISVLVPLLVLWATGHSDWSIYAAFGAFTSLYGRNRIALPRLELQALLAVLLTGAVGLGAWVSISDHRTWLAVPIAGVIAGVGAWLSDVQDWHPPGPLFVIFAFTAVASIPGRAGDVPVALAVAGAAAAFSMLVAQTGAAIRRLRDRAVATPVPRRPWAWRAGEPRHIARAAVAVTLAGACATGVGIGHPYWAMVSAAVPLVARTPRGQLVRSIHRVVGTAAGLGLAALLLTAGPTGLALIATIAALQICAELLVGRNYAVALIAITPLALLMVQMVAPAATGVLLFDRGVETVIGVVIGLAVGVAVRDPGRGAPPAPQHP